MGRRRKNIVNAFPKTLLLATALSAAASVLTPSAAGAAQGVPEVPTSQVGNTGPAIRPPAIGISADGNGNLSHLQWSQWGPTSAEATGFQDDRTCWESCNKWVARPVTVELTKPVSEGGQLLFSEMTVSGPSTPRATYTVATPTPAPSLSGQWWYVGYSELDRIIDVVRLDLIDFPAGTLHGSWTESVAPGYSSVGLNGTECLGCNGAPGAYSNSFDLTGSGTPSSFSIQIGNNAGETLTGALGALPAGAAHAYGCTPPTGRLGDLFLVDGSALILFYRPAAYSGQIIGVGAPVTCAQ
jgi:hypothetical protein